MKHYLAKDLLWLQHPTPKWQWFNLGKFSVNKLSVESSYLELDEKREGSVCNIEKRSGSDVSSQATDDAEDFMKRHVELWKDHEVFTTEHGILVGNVAAAEDDMMITIRSEGGWPCLWLWRVSKQWGIIQIAHSFIMPFLEVPSQSKVQ